MKGRVSVIICLVLTANLTVTAASSSPWAHVPAKDHARSNPVASQPKAIAAGALLYADDCTQCHQADARGDRRKKPSLRTESVRTATDGDLEWFIHQGDLRHGMPSWSSLPQAQRWEIVAYLRSLQIGKLP